MDCSLAALIACFSMSNLYVDAGLAYEDVIYWEVNQTTLALESVPKNPMGRATLGYELRFRNAAFAIEASHVSSVVTGNDGGTNSIGIKARWYPFKRRD